MTTPAEVTKEFFSKRAFDEATRPIVRHPEDYKKFLRDVDERVLPRRKDESGEGYGKRMRQHMNGDPTRLRQIRT